MNGFNQDLQNDYLKLQHLANNDQISEDAVLKIIGDYDSKYKDNQFHYEYAEGLLSNVGKTLKSTRILKSAIKRLLTKTDKKLRDKYYYDIGNTICSKADIEYLENPNVGFLIDNKSYLEAKKYLSMVSSNDENHYLRAITNISNILDKYGRNYEAIHKYDEALDLDSAFGMALGNKAQALHYYMRLSPYKALPIYHRIKELLSSALRDKRLIEIGGVRARNHFLKLEEQIADILSREGYVRKKTRLPRRISDYERFVLDRNLYLNYDFGFYYDKDSIVDDFFPQLTENASDKKSKKVSFMAEKTFYTFKVFNQLVEDYTSARHSFFATITDEKEAHSKVNYIYLYDYSRHSVRNGNIKHIISVLYNCLDKVAHCVKYYFHDEEIQLNENIYFVWLTSPEAKQLIKDRKNYQLLALQNLSLDFQEGYSHSDLRDLRNRITHSFISVKSDVGGNKTDQHEITERDLVRKAETMFMLVKSAIFYLISAVNSYKTDNELYGTMLATLEDEIYGI